MSPFSTHSFTCSGYIYMYGGIDNCHICVWCLQFTLVVICYILVGYRILFDSNIIRAFFAYIPSKVLTGQLVRLIAVVGS